MGPAPSVRLAEGEREDAVLLWLLGQGVFEVVGVLAVGDDDVHFAGEAGELAGGGVGDYGDAELGDASSHGGAVLEDEGAGAALEGAGDDFEGDVTAGGVFRAGSGGEHGSFGCGLLRSSGVG